MSTDLQWLPARVEVYRSPARCKFLTAESFLSVALQAYLAASKDLVPPSGEPWVDEGATWASAQGFYDGLLHEIEQRLRLAALVSGDLFERFYQDTDPGAGRSLAVMAHGCAASSPAVGPAPTKLASQSSTQAADRSFFAPERLGTALKRELGN